MRPDIPQGGVVNHARNKGISQAFPALGINKHFHIVDVVLPILSGKVVFAGAQMVADLAFPQVIANLRHMVGGN